MTSLEIERKLISQGYRLIGGVDEVGRGCLAGPVAAGFVIFPPDVDDSLLSYVTDSKKFRVDREYTRPWGECTHVSGKL